MTKNTQEQSQSRWTRRTFECGVYEGHEGVQVTADKQGITITGWYDGGMGFSSPAHLTWEELAEMRQVGAGPNQ